MEPISAAILAAVVKLAEPAIRDAYEGVKSLVVRRFGAGSRVAKAMDEAEAKPESTGRRAVLEEELAEVKAGDDAELRAAVEALARRLEEHGVPVANVRVEARGARSVAIGGSATGNTIRTGDEGTPGR